jgi:hypothetical protein
MRTILVLNDNSAEAENAAEFALDIAQKTGADLLVLNLCKSHHPKPVAKQILAAIEHNQREDYLGPESLIKHLYGRVSQSEFKPVIWEIDAWEHDEQHIAGIIISKNISLIVRGVKTGVNSGGQPHSINMQAVLNRVSVPMLIIPGRYAKHRFENIAYVVDLRYCRPAVVKFLADLAERYDSAFVVQHLPAHGLPPLIDNYARQLFDAIAGDKVNHKKIYFNNIKERNLNVALDVMIDGLHVDLLAMANNRYHFGELFGAGIADTMPDSVHVPVMIFPS